MEFGTLALITQPAFSVRCSPCARSGAFPSCSASWWRGSRSATPACKSSIRPSPPSASSPTSASHWSCSSLAATFHCATRGCTVPASSAAPAAPSREEIIAQFGSQTPVEWGLEVTGVVQRSTSPQVALTLDACGGPSGSAVDQELIDLLRTSQTPATLFLNARWIDANPALTEQLIAEDLFCIANHGTQHVPLSANGRAAYGIPGTASIGAAYDEVMGNQHKLTALMGEPPRFFRPGTAHYDEVCAAMDQASAGSICIGHFNQPAGSTFEGLAQAITQLRASGLTFARLDEMTLS